MALLLLSNIFPVMVTFHSDFLKIFSCIYSLVDLFKEN